MAREQVLRVAMAAISGTFATMAYGFPAQSQVPGQLTGVESMGPPSCRWRNRSYPLGSSINKVVTDQITGEKDNVVLKCELLSPGSQAPRLNEDPNRNRPAQPASTTAWIIR
jgi:hypothetical protein